MPITLEHRRINNIDLVTAHGDLDLTTAATLHNYLQSHAATADRGIVVDLSAVAFLDCTALGALIAARNAAQTNAVDISVICAPNNRLVNKLLTLTGAATRLPIHTSLASALAPRPPAG